MQAGIIKKYKKNTKTLIFLGTSSDKKEFNGKCQEILEGIAERKRSRAIPRVTWTDNINAYKEQEV